MKRVRTSICAAGLLVAAACADSTGPADAIDCTGAWQPVADRLAAAVNAHGLAEGAVVVSVDGRVRCVAALGGADPDQAVIIQSGTKWLAAAAVLAALPNAAALDHPVSDWLPSFSARVPITIRQLLSHTSGLPASVPCLSNGTTLASCADVIAATAPQDAPPGTTFAYGATSLSVAGAVAESAADAAFLDLFGSRITGPLGMGLVVWNNSVLPLLGGGAEVAVADYGRFVEMLAMGGVFRGRRVLSEAAITEMRRNHTGGLPRVNPPRAGDYGLGSWLEATDPGSGLATVLSSPGTGGFLPWVDFGRRIGGVVWLPDDTGASWTSAWEIVALVRQLVDGGTP